MRRQATMVIYRVEGVTRCVCIVDLGTVRKRKHYLQRENIVSTFFSIYPMSFWSPVTGVLL